MAAPPPLDAPRPATGILRAGVHLFPVHVYFEDTDAGGIVYHASYLRFMERARTDLLSHLDIDQRTALEHGGGVYAITGLSIRYLKPARLSDDIVVATRPESVAGASVAMRQTIWRGTDQLTAADVTAAFVSPSGRPIRQPGQWRNALAALLPEKESVAR